VVLYDFMTLGDHNVILWVVTPCSLGGWIRAVRSSMLPPSEDMDGRNMLLKNADNNVQEYTVSQARGPHSGILFYIMTELHSMCKANLFLCLTN
jgi:hypothetical protein